MKIVHAHHTGEERRNGKVNFRLSLKDYITVITLAVGLILAFGRVQWGMDALAEKADKNCTRIEAGHEKDEQQDKDIVQIQEKVENIDRNVQQVQVKQEDNTKLLNQILGKLGG